MSEGGRSVEEKDLLELAKAGDQEAFVKLYRRYYPVVYRFCMTFGGIDADTAKDVLQESFIRAFRHIDKLREGQKFLAWLLTITRNRCLSYLSKEDGFDRKHLAWSREADLLLAGTTAETFETERQIKIVQEVIEEMPDSGMKDCAKAFYTQGLSTSEIAETLGIPKSTVTTRLDRFRTRIRKRLLARLMIS